MAAMSILLLVVIAFGVAVSCVAAHRGSHVSSRKLQDDDSVCSIHDPLMYPTHEVRHGRDTVWQVPRNPKGIIFLAHGYSKGPFSYFDRSWTCQMCYGLPEDRSIALEALRRGYALIAVKSLGISFNYASLDWSQDLENVINIINDIRSEQKLDSGLPFVAFGVSSGGFFSTILASKIPTRALLLMTSEGQIDIVESATPDDFPPTFFAYMNTTLDQDIPAEINSREITSREIISRGISTRDAVELSMAILSERGVSVGWKLCLPQPIPPLYFTERLPCTSDEDSAKMQRAYKSAGWLDEADYLILDPDFLDWLAPLPKSSWPSWYVPSRKCGTDHICQELLRAWAYHVTTGDANEEMFDWLDAKLSGDVDQLLLSDCR